MTLAFELLRFEAAPVSAAVALVELDGVFDGPAPARVRLLVEREGATLEVPALGAGGEDPWTASFAVELAALDDATFALVPGRGPLIALPEPTTAADAGDDRFVRLARQANELRHRLEEAVAASAARERLGDELAGERDALRTQLEAETTRADAAERTAAAARDQRDSANASAEAARTELAAARDRTREAEARATEAERDRAALRARAEAADRTIAELRERADDATGANERAAAAEAEVRTLRHDLREARARIEALERETRHHADTIRRGHEVEPDAADAPTTSMNGDDATQAMPITTTRRTKVIKLDDGEGADVEAGAEAEAEEDRERRIVRRIEGLTIDTGEVLDPAAVGARYIEPAETPTPLLTPARILVGVALLVFAIVFVAILLGAGIV